MAVVTAAQKAPIDVVLHDKAFGPFRVLSPASSSARRPKECGTSPTFRRGPTFISHTA